MTRTGERSRDVIGPEAARTLDELFRERVHRTPGRPAYTRFDRQAGVWQTLTWEDAARQVARWQSGFAGEGLAPGERVALALRNSPEWVFFDQAALALGLVTVPLYPEDRPENQVHVLRDSGASAVLLQDAGALRRLGPHLGDLPSLQRVLLLGESRGAPELDDARVRLVENWLPAEAQPAPPRPPDPGALASIVYTSGTTGRAKGVMLSHRNILSVTQAALRIVDCYREDTFLSFLPLSHTLERTAGYYLPMAAGSSVAFARSVQQLAEDLQQVRPTLMIAVPRVFERFYGRIQQQIAEGSAVKRWLFRATESVGWRRFEHGQGRGNWSPALLLWPLLSHLVAAKVLGRLGGRLRLAVSGGAALSGPVGRLFVGLGLPLLQGYGLTETSPVISVNTPENNDPASVGPPLPGLEWRLSEEGELQVRSPWVMMGYWNNPEATAQVLEKDGWLHTGDKVAFRDGRFYITGRLKEILVLSNGENVPPGDLESAILLDGLFEQAMVVGEGRPFLSAVLVLSRERWQGFARDLGVDPERPESLTDSRVVGAVTGRVASQLREFPGYARVRRVVLSLDPWTVDNGLLTPTMKLRRARVLEAHGDAVEALYETGPTAARRRRPG